MTGVVWSSGSGSAGCGVAGVFAVAGVRAAGPLGDGSLGDAELVPWESAAHGFAVVRWEPWVRAAGPMWSSAPTGCYVCAEVRWEIGELYHRASSARPYSGKPYCLLPDAYCPQNTHPYCLPPPKHASPTAYCLMPTA